MADSLQNVSIVVLCSLIALTCFVIEAEARSLDKVRGESAAPQKPCFVQRSFVPAGEEHVTMVCGRKTELG